MVKLPSCLSSVTTMKSDTCHEITVDKARNEASDRGTHHHNYMLDAD